MEQEAGLLAKEPLLTVAHLEGAPQGLPNGTLLLSGRCGSSGHYLRYTGYCRDLPLRMNKLRERRQQNSILDTLKSRYCIIKPKYQSMAIFHQVAFDGSSLQRGLMISLNKRRWTWDVCIRWEIIAFNERHMHRFGEASDKSSSRACGSVIFQLMSGWGIN